MAALDALQLDGEEGLNVEAVGDGPSHEIVAGSDYRGLVPGRAVLPHEGQSLRRDHGLYPRRHELFTPPEQLLGRVSQEWLDLVLYGLVDVQGSGHVLGVETVVPDRERPSDRLSTAPTSTRNSPQACSLSPASRVLSRSKSARATGVP